MAEKDYSVLVAAVVAIVAIVGLVVQFSGGAAGMLPADYGAAFRPTYPALERGTCPEGYTETDTVCTGSIYYKHENREMCYRTGDLYCISDKYAQGELAAPREFGAEKRFVAHEEDCFLTPSDSAGTQYHLCN